MRDLTLESLTAAVGVVSQDPHLFHDTVAANLRYARPEATDEELVAACRAARIHDVIAALPDGYDTVVGERGYRLSGGEKQRLSIARLLLKAPAVVVLDEATSHLDSENEALIQQALGVALAGRTAVVIAHRLSTIAAADQILVLDGGRIVERGRHADLLRARRPLRRAVRHPVPRPPRTPPTPGPADPHPGHRGTVVDDHPPPPGRAAEHVGGRHPGVPQLGLTRLRRPSPGPPGGCSRRG